MGNDGKYGESKFSNQYAMPNYVACAPRMYKGTLESLVRRMIPFADLIQINSFKITTSYI